MNLIRFVGDNMEDEPIKELKTLKEWMKRKIKYAIKSKEYANPRCPNCEKPMEYIKNNYQYGKVYRCRNCKVGKIIS